MRIAFGQQPCGFFPKRFLYSKIVTARRLRDQLGGEIVFFFHDSDHDHRETLTVLRDRDTGKLERINFAFLNRVQKKYTPLYAKAIAPGWQEETSRRLARFVNPDWIEVFAAVKAETVADFCLQMYAGLGLLEGIQVVRSSAPEFRNRAARIDDFFVDLKFRRELVRARRAGEGFRLHRGGGRFHRLPDQPFGAHQISPTCDTRLVWMQSVLKCTHYVAGASEMNYLKKEETPQVTFIERDPIAESGLAYVG